MKRNYFIVMALVAIDLAFIGCVAPVETKVNETTSSIIKKENSEETRVIEKPETTNIPNFKFGFVVYNEQPLQERIYTVWYQWGTKGEIRKAYHDEVLLWEVTGGVKTYNEALSLVQKQYGVHFSIRENEDALLYKDDLSSPIDWRGGIGEQPTMYLPWHWHMNSPDESGNIVLWAYIPEGRSYCK